MRAMYGQTNAAMSTQILTIGLSIFGIIGSLALVAITFSVFWHFHDVRLRSIRWYRRNAHLMQLSAIATFFFLAMAASYAVLGEIWMWLYFLVAFKTGTWWLGYALKRRA
jgi:hypothetical protein